MAPTNRIGIVFNPSKSERGELERATHRGDLDVGGHVRIPSVS